MPLRFLYHKKLTSEVWVTVKRAELGSHVNEISGVWPLLSDQSVNINSLGPVPQVSVFVKRRFFPRVGVPSTCFRWKRSLKERFGFTNCIDKVVWPPQVHVPLESTFYWGGTGDEIEYQTPSRPRGHKNMADSWRPWLLKNSRYSCYWYFYVWYRSSSPYMQKNFVISITHSERSSD